MKALAWIFAIVLTGLGVIFVTGSQGMASRIVIGVVLLAAAVAIIAVAQLRPKQGTIVQKIELPAQSKLREFTCTKCGAPLPSDALKMNDVGAVLVSCPYCKASYQVEEAPKW